MPEYDENYFNNLASNGVISGDEIRLFVGRILQYGYRGTISTSWRSQNEAAANSIAQAYATQLLIWETVIGERDVNFNHVAASGCSNVKDVINAKHPLRNKIFSYYNSMVQSVQNHATIPSFCNKSSGSAKTIELEWNGSKYTTTLTDSNNVLSKYNFKASISGVSFSVNGNKLTVSMDTAPSKEFTITATKKNAVRRGVVVWSEGKHGQNSSVQDVVSYAQEVSDSINGYVKMKVSYGSCQIVKTSEDGKVDGINFTITGNGINQTVTTANGGKFQIDNLMPGIYTVTEQAYDKYEPQETHRVTVVAGQIAKVTFNNKLKRGDLQVVKSSEDNLVEGVKFHLFGTSLSGDAVDQYAVTDKNGVATFKDVLISGSEPYTLEEVDTAIRYVVPKNQTVPVKWKEVTTRNFNNILKKFTVTVTKSDAEKGEAQGNAKLSGAVYGIYKGETLVDKYVTDENGQFTTKEYVCDIDWTIREITPSEGYLLDKTKEQLENDTEALLTTARKHLCQFATLRFQQVDGLNTVMPFGTRKIDAFRTLTTESLSVFIPFRVQDIFHENGIYYGQNVISKNMIIADRKQLLNGNSFILGVSGGGKSFAAKGEIINQVLSSDADIIIIDPEREYSQLVNAMGGEVINISATSDNHINAMDMNKDYGDGANPVILKSEFIMSLCEQLIGGTNLGAKQKSIIDRCTASVYRSYQQNDYQGHIPTLQDFRAELLQQDEPEAKELALAIELFTHGSLNTFAKQTNVDTNNRLICYDILDLGKQLMPIGMLVVLDSILNRITQNRAKGKNTFIFIDEIYLLFQHEYSANFLFTLWKRVRKYGAYASGITQNVDDLLQSHTARTMLANSEFIIMLNQASTDRLELAKLLNISDLQMSYITNVEAGHGLIKVGSSLVPFANKFPKNTKLYKLMTTKPGEA